MKDQKNNSQEADQKCSRNSKPGSGLVFGIPIGVAVGAATGHMGAWLAFGIAVGLAFEGVYTKAHWKREKEN